MDEIKGLVSIIVPVYNVEEYITKCIETILIQTYKNFELILINDGSTDNSLKIIKKLNDSRVKVYSKENGGLSSARNYGLKYSRGEYVVFIDSDDWIKDTYLEVLVNNLEKHNADIVECGFIMEFQNKRIEKKNNKIIVFNPKKQPEKMKLLKVSAWNKIYRKENIVKNQLEFPEGIWFEDFPFTIPHFMTSKKIVLLNESLYFYRQREGSITKQKKFNKKYFDLFKGIEILEKNMKKLDVYFEFKCFFEYLKIRKLKIDLSRILLKYKINDLDFDNKFKLNFYKDIKNPYLRLRERLYLIYIYWRGY